VVVIEPDALGDFDCMTAAQITERNGMLAFATQQFHDRAPNTWAYLDAGNAGWVPAATMAQRLQDAGIADARGFAVNVSNYYTTSASVTYANDVRTGLGTAKPFVIDTSRNGNPLNGDDWCNPAGQKVGAPPRTGGATGLDLQLWVKPPGESDGDCGIGAGTEAGDFSPAMAMKLLG
jgi:endoglucanase